MAQEGQIFFLKKAKGSSIHKASTTLLSKIDRST